MICKWFILLNGLTSHIHSGIYWGISFLFWQVLFINFLKILWVILLYFKILCLNMEESLTEFLSLKQNTWEEQLKGEKVSFGWRCQRFQSLVAGLLCFWASGEAEHWSREGMVEQSCSPHGDWEQERDRVVLGTKYNPLPRPTPTTGPLLPSFTYLSHALMDESVGGLIPCEQFWAPWSSNLWTVPLNHFCKQPCRGHFRFQLWEFLSQGVHC